VAEGNGVEEIDGMTTVAGEATTKGTACDSSPVSPFCTFN
jgi:hypothetical protein